jgi:hypothetical protein
MMGLSTSMAWRKLAVYTKEETRPTRSEENETRRLLRLAEGQQAWHPIWLLSWTTTQQRTDSAA